jgi:hypothetical protein
MGKSFMVDDHNVRFGDMNLFRSIHPILATIRHLDGKRDTLDLRRFDHITSHNLQCIINRQGQGKNKAFLSGIPIVSPLLSALSCDSWFFSRIMCEFAPELPRRNEEYFLRCLFRKNASTNPSPSDNRNLRQRADSRIRVLFAGSGMIIAFLWLKHR